MLGLVHSTESNFFSCFRAHFLAFILKHRPNLVVFTYLVFRILLKVASLFWHPPPFGSRFVSYSESTTYSFHALYLTPPVFFFFFLHFFDASQHAPWRTIANDLFRKLGRDWNAIRANYLFVSIISVLFKIALKRFFFLCACVCVSACTFA